MAVLVVAAADSGGLKEAIAKVVTAALQISPEVDVLVAGENVSAAASQAAEIAGVRGVLHADGASLAKYVAEALEALVLPLADRYDAILFPADTSGKNAAPRIAAKLDVMQVSAIIAVLGPKTFKRPIYAGNAIVTVEATDAKIIATVQPTAFKAAGVGGHAPIEALAAPAADPRVTFVAEELAASERPELAGAKRVVSGGRALGGADQFKALIEPLADALGAAVGASRAAVDAGYAPNDYQVGQTGKVVAPDLYVAVGISGAIQHLAGMKDSRIIVAINKDEEAPIFQIADYGLVGDLFTLVPELTTALKKLSP